MSMRKALTITAVFIFLAGCAAPAPKMTPLFSDAKSAKIIIVSNQKNQRLQFRSNGQIGLIPALIVQEAAAKNAGPVIQAFRSRNIGSELAESIREKVQVFSGFGIDEIIVWNSVETLNVASEVGKCQSDVLVVINAQTAMLPEQNVIEVSTLVSIYDASTGGRTSRIDKPLQAIVVETQSVQFGVPYPKPTTRMIPKTEEKAAAEIVAIEARFRNEIKKNPSKQEELEKQRNREIRISKSMKTTAEVRPTAVQALVRNNYQLFNQIYDDLIPNAALTVLAGLDDVWAMNLDSRKREATRFRIAVEGSPSALKDGYVIGKFSTQDRTVFRSLPSLGGPALQIYSFPKSNGAIFSGSDLFLELQEE